jgi:hypothetical protein
LNASPVTISASAATNSASSFTSPTLAAIAVKSVEPVAP